MASHRTPKMACHGPTGRELIATNRGKFGYINTCQYKEARLSVWPLMHHPLDRVLYMRTSDQFHKPFMANDLRRPSRNCTTSAKRVGRCNKPATAAGICRAAALRLTWPAPRGSMTCALPADLGPPTIRADFVRRCRH